MIKDIMHINSEKAGPSDKTDWSARDSGPGLPVFVSGAEDTRAPGRQRDCFALGRQLTVDYYSCNTGCLLSRELLEKAMLSAAEESGATVISSSFHDFRPQGVSGVVIIAESHFTIHAWPEHDYAAVDIFTCGDSIDFEVAVNSLRQSLGSSRVVVSTDLTRGLLPGPSIPEPAKGGTDLSGAYAITWKRDQESTNAWGMLSAVDVYGCNGPLLHSVSEMSGFLRKICAVLGLECRNGDQVSGGVNEKKGDPYTLSRMVGNTTLSAHVVPANRAVYLDVFSSDAYEPRYLAQAAVDFLDGSHYKMHIALRK